METVNIRSILGRCLVAAGLLLCTVVSNAADTGGFDRGVPIYFFWGDGCPHCAQEEPFLEGLKERYPRVELRDFEVWNHPENKQRLLDMAQDYDIRAVGVPMTFIGDRVWVGFSEHMKVEMEDQIKRCLQSGCPAPGSEAAAGEVAAAPPFRGATSDLKQTIEIPLLGEVDLARHSLWFTTVLIAFVDGFNPCSLWVLSLLLAIVIYSGSRKKILAVGLTFLTITASVYALFIAGLFNVFAYVSYIGWIQVLVALLALGFGMINVKDYFWFKKGISLTIADRYKPKIFKDIRNVISPDKSLPAMMGATAVMALGITLVELPCTAGFPVIWSNIIAANDPGLFGFMVLLGIYLLIYLLDEIAVFLSVVITLKASKFEEKQGRVLKLIGGMIMLALGSVLLVNPELMNHIGSSVLIFGAALLTSFAIMLAHRRWGGNRERGS